ncbi:MAG: transglutaminase-like domain-containing protein [Pseudomonadales bacterium]|nr:transglutaminase-like domain-containing protein [Pseudomonadales bacterium]
MKREDPLLHQFRTAQGFVRTTAITIILSFFSVFYSPSLLAIQKAHDQGTLFPEESVLKEVPEHLVNIKQALKDYHYFSNLNNQIVRNKKNETEYTFAEIKEKIRTNYSYLSNQYDVLIDLDEQVMEEFDASKKRLHDKKMPQLILDRHKEKVDNYKSNMSKVITQLKKLSETRSDKKRKKAVEVALNHLNQYDHRPPRQEYNAEQLPFGVSPDSARAPIRDQQALNEMLGFETDQEQGSAAQTSAAPIESDLPTEADLAPNIDVQINEDIQNLAAELGHDPVQIYNWVYNNIEYIPSYGSIQGSVHTLHNEKGNAFDTSSLLIALLRASNIPARYVYGTIRIPIEEAQNWVGGVDNPESARVLFSQGGIPSTAISYGGAFEEIEIEHVWVQAYGDFGPNDGEEWVVMDGSYKQYEYTEGIDLYQNIGFDGREFESELLSHAEINDIEGWAYLEQAMVNSKIGSIRESIKQFLDNQMPSATASEVFGSKEIRDKHIERFINKSNYKIVIENIQSHTLPNNLRFKFHYNLYQSSVLGSEGKNIFTWEIPLPQLVGKELALSFRPATEEDELALLQLLPETTSGLDGIGETFYQDLTNVQLVAELTLDGEVYMDSGIEDFPMGAVLHSKKGFFNPAYGEKLKSATVIAGQYKAIGINAQGIAGHVYSGILSKLNWMKSNLENNQLDGYNRHQFMGEIMQMGILGYFGFTDIHAQVIAKEMNAVHYRMPSFGTFSSHLQVDYSIFGNPINAKPVGVVVDVNSALGNNEIKNNCWKQWVNLNQRIGLMSSSNEHIIPEIMFSAGDTDVEAVSTVKLLKIAAEQGQKVYTINEDNIDSVFSQLTIDDAVKNEIRRGIETGLIAVTHENNIDVNGWFGSGYFLINPLTGASSAIVSDGYNGGVALLFFAAAMFIAFFLSPYIGVLSAIFASASINLIISHAALAFGAAFAGAAVIENNNMNFENSENACSAAVMLISVGIGGLIASPAGGTILGLGMGTASETGFVNLFCAAGE